MVNLQIQVGSFVDVESFDAINCTKDNEQFIGPSLAGRTTDWIKILNNLNPVK